MIDLNADQLSLILSLLQSEKYDILADIEAPDKDLSQASASILESRFWELSNLEQFLLNPKTTASQNNAND